MMEKKFRFLRFLGALFLPFLSFAIIYAIAMFIYIRLFYSHCSAPIFEESEGNFLFMLAIVLFVFQILTSILINRRSKNIFVLIGFIISISLTILVFHRTIIRKLTYKSRMTNLANWSDEYKKDDMVGYFINHDTYIGKTYAEVMNDLGEPRKTKIPGKFVYEVSHWWMYEVYFENDKCVRQELYCFGTGAKYSRTDYDKENF